ncbi:flavodoxin family protein [Bacillus sp. SJS]|uniref:flavodoxin family protein n=1 Tax=Bacillus sp. SJS TaxID=1423321 RepID=UPI0004DCC0B2|nr:flavodoxin family protein [Bacillus sp. SJS]KZZ85291.1 hypothetical protein AS29_006825 [Bacillus sp. SJS]
MKILAIYGSSRKEGNSHLLAEKVLEGINHHSVWLKDYQIMPIEDGRHEAEGFKPVEDDYDEVIERFMDADLVVFVTPLYWYGMSGLMKTFVDRWSQSLRDERYSFKELVKGKRGIVIIAGGDKPKLKALPLVQQFSLIMEYMGMEFNGYLIGEGNKPGEVLNDDAAVNTAAEWNKRLK